MLRHKILAAQVENPPAWDQNVLRVESTPLHLANHGVARLDVRSIRRILLEVAKAKGLPDYNPHLLRHACASHLHDHGAPLQAIAALLGHAKLSTAQMYTRVSVGRMMQTYNGAHPHAKSR